MNNSVKHFDIAFDRTMMMEGAGALSNDPNDPGGMTYSGISKRYWPEWEGWPLIAKRIEDGGLSVDDGITLGVMVRNFYRINFWNRVQGDALAEVSPEVAYEVYDTAVNIGVSGAVEFLQTAHNIAAGFVTYPLEVDGKLGLKTIKAIDLYLATPPGRRKINEEILLNCQNGEQYIFYKKNPRHKYFRGWFRRV